MRVRSVVSGLFIFGSLLMNNVGYAANTEPDADTPVIAVQETASKSGCKVSVDKQPEKACSLGAVIWADEMTYGQAKANGIKDYAVLEKDANKAKQRREELVRRVHERYQKGKSGQNNAIRAAFGVSASSCSAVNRNINGTYTFSSNTPGQPTVNYNLQYYLRSDCVVVSIYDKTKASGTSNGSSVQWTQSCTNATVSSNPQCVVKNVYLGTNYTSQYQEINSTYLARYQNNAQVPNHYAFGYWDMD